MKEKKITVDKTFLSKKDEYSNLLEYYKHLGEISKSKTEEKQKE